MKKLFLLICCCWTSVLPAQQTLVLDSVLQQAKDHYPLVRQQALIDQQRDFSLATLNRGLLPQLSINGQASYQSAVTSVPIPVTIPGFTIETLDKDQYRLNADLNQVLYDGGNISNQKKIQRASAEVEQARVEVELQKVRERVRQYFLGVLMIEEQIRQLEITSKDIDAGILRMESAVKNGVALRSQLSVLQAEFLRNKQRLSELSASHNSLLQTISLYTGNTYAEDIKLSWPNAAINTVSAGTALSVQRPELKLFAAQQSVTDRQRKWIGSKSMPRLSLFGQGGYGRPGLNMLDNDFAFYYIAGARLNWNLGAFYTLPAERNNNRIGKMTTDINREIYMRNVEVTLTQYRNDISKTEQLLRDDESIISLREEIMKATKAQLENGVITSSDYLREVNAFDQARQNKLLHQLQILQTRLDLQDYISTNK